jgi:hypothetical protein
MLLAKRNDYSECGDVTLEGVMNLVMDIRDGLLTSLVGTQDVQEAEAFRQRLIIINRVLDIPALLQGDVS